MRIRIGIAAALAVACGATACHKADPGSATNGVDYMGPAAKAMDAQRAQRPDRPVPAPPADIHDGPRYPWLRIKGPGQAHAMLGVHAFGITAFVRDGRDREHLLTALYKGNCQIGWQPFYKAGILGTAFLTRPTGNREIPTPSMPWIESQLQSTCKTTAPMTSMTDHEAMWEMMSAQT